MLLLHISDIHFKAKEFGRPDDPNLALRNDIVRDVEATRKRIGHQVDHILVSGDIAFAGKKEEYEYALDWFENSLCPAAGCTLDKLFVVPGNHDVDRQAGSKIAQRGAKANIRTYGAREIDAVIREYMSDTESASVLFAPIHNYNNFAANFLCQLSPFDKEADRHPFARRDVVLNDGSILRLWGFNTVLVSDISDSDKEKNLIIDPSAAQIEIENGVTHLVMCHHPFNWLRNGQAFQDRIEKAAKIQLFGHEHTRRVDEGRKFTRIRAGAIQPDRDEDGWKPGYNFIDVSVKGAGADRQLALKIWFRQLDGSNFIAIPDEDGSDPWCLLHDLPAWVNTSVPPEPKAEVSEMASSDESQEAPKATKRMVILKLLRLPPHEQQRLIVDLELNEDGDQLLKDYEVAVASVRRADEQLKLDDMDRRLDEYLNHGGDR